MHELAAEQKKYNDNDITGETVAENMTQKLKPNNNKKHNNVLSTILDLVNICANRANIGDFAAKINIFAWKKKPMKSRIEKKRQENV